MKTEGKKISDAELAEYMKDKTCLIVDTNSVSRTSIVKFLVSIGANKDRVFVVDNVSEALEQIDRYYPDIIVTENMVGRSSGLDLLNKHLEVKKDRLKGSFFVITQSNSMAVAAEIAELEVDGLITKPFTINGLKVTFINGLAHKINPGQYFTELEKAKMLLREKSFEQALQILKECRTYSKEPSNACYYEGSIFEEMTKMLEAKNSYNDGLKFNPEHFRCMNQLFKIHIQEKNYDEAYSLGSKLFKLFPMSPNKIPDLTRMMIAKEKFQDIYDIAEKFSHEDNLDPQAVSYIAAAMAVTAKHYAKVGNNDEAMRAVNKGAQLSGGAAKILRNMVQTCLSINKPQEAEKLLKMVTESEQNTDQYYAMDFEIANHTLPAGELVKRGLELVKKGHKDPAIYTILISRAIEDKRKDDFISNLKQEAHQLYPTLSF